MPIQFDSFVPASFVCSSTSRARNGSLCTLLHVRKSYQNGEREHITKFVMQSMHQPCPSIKIIIARQRSGSVLHCRQKYENLYAAQWCRHRLCPLPLSFEHYSTVRHDTWKQHTHTHTHTRTHRANQQPLRCGVESVVSTTQNNHNKDMSICGIELRRTNRAFDILFIFAAVVVFCNSVACRFSRQLCSVCVCVCVCRSVVRMCTNRLWAPGHDSRKEFFISMNSWRRRE